MFFVDIFKLPFFKAFLLYEKNFSVILKTVPDVFGFLIKNKGAVCFYKK